jgi:ATP-dependent DNA helicase RecQ
LVVDVLGRGERFDLDLGELGDDVDLRPLVLRTALTHLELDEIVQQGTPWYGVYKIEALVGVDEILKKFSTEKAAYIEAVFGFCKKGRTLLTLQLDTIVRAGHDRTRVVKALEFLAEQGLVTLQVSDLRHSFKRGPAAANVDIDGVVAKLHARFALHERREIERLAAVLALVTADHCQTNHLVAHFGETRGSDCGHCSWCQTRTAVVLPPQRPAPDFARLIDPAAFGALVSAHPKALALPRQQARFLCGLTSPATTKAKLSKHALMGALEQYRFDDVLAWRAGSTHATN